MFISLSNASALQVVENVEIEGYEPVKIKESDNALPWELFAKTKQIQASGTDPEGFDYEYLKPGYSEEIKKLDGTKIRVKGYIFPLDGSEKQKRFLFGPYPISCPFHYHANPNQVINVKAEEPIKSSYDPIIIEGTLELPTNHSDAQIFYLLKDAVLK